MNTLNLRMPCGYSRFGAMYAPTVHRFTVTNLTKMPVKPTILKEIAYFVGLIHIHFIWVLSKAIEWHLRFECHHKTSLDVRQASHEHAVRPLGSRFIAHRVWCGNRTGSDIASVFLSSCYARVKFTVSCVQKGMMACPFVKA